MRSVALAVLIATLTCLPSSGHARKLWAGTFSFESVGSTPGKPLGEWSGWPNGTVALDTTVVHEGRFAMRLERAAGRTDPFSGISVTFPADFEGDSLELRGWMKLEDVVGYVGLWQRQDAGSNVVGFDNMAPRSIDGTRDWQEYRSVVALSPKAKTVYVGAILVGSGRLWVDDVQVRVDGKPIAQLAVKTLPQTVLDTDREFDAGSRIADFRPTPAQVANLAMLGKVWGFLKYHHPVVASGKRHWDYDLFRILPAVIAARDARAAQAALAGWVDSLGDVPPCRNCAGLADGLPIAPPVAWIRDRSSLGEALSSRLTAIHERREKRDESFYVSFAGAQNPDFEAELPYASLKEPDAGYRLLALFRLWNMVEYWFPYRDVMQEDWDATLREFVPRLLAARGRDAYAAELMALVARLHDTHANLWSSLEVQPPIGRWNVPAAVRFVEDRALVTGWTHARLGPASGLQVGDVIESVDGVRVKSLVERWRPMYAASNEPTRLRDVSRNLLRGDSTAARLVVRRGARGLSLAVPRSPLDSLGSRRGETHDHGAPAFRRLSDDIAYLVLGQVKGDDIGAYLKGAEGAKLLVIDQRNYPSDFIVFTLGQHLVSERTPFAKFTRGDAGSPGAFAFAEPVVLEPQPPHLGARVAILVDEITQSSSEYHALAFRAAPGAFVVGSTTAGADGNVSVIPLPGGLRTLFSGIGVFWPDGRPTQRVGILPDIEVRPTIRGIAAGRDEVLDAAVRHALGRLPTPGEYRALGTTGPPAP